MLEYMTQTRGGAVWQLVGLITRRSQVQILSPQPNLVSKIKGMRWYPFSIGKCSKRFRLDTNGLGVITSSTPKAKDPMFAKTLISLLSALTIVIGLVVFIRNGESVIFAIGMIAYFLIAISDNLCAASKRYGSPKR